MEDYGVVLQNNLVVRSSNFGSLSNLVFTKDGKVSSFNYMNTHYTAIFVFSTSKFIEYAKTDEFNRLITIEKNKKGANYSGVPLNLWKNTKVPSLDITFKDYDTLSKLNYNEKIYGALRDQTGLCFNYYTWIYTNPYVNPVDPELAPGAGASFGCEVLEPNTSARIFFDAYKDKKFYDLGVIQKDEKLVGEVAALMKSTAKQMLDAFNEFAVAGVDAGEFAFTEDTDGNYSRQELIDYKNGLERWIQIYKENVPKLSGLKDPEKLYIMCDILYKYNMLGNLTVPQKISILLTLCDGPLIGWYFTAKKTGFQDRETLAVRVVKAVTVEQAGEFLDALIANKLQVVKGTVVNALSPIINPSGGYEFEPMCLYRVLFRKIDDYFGQDNFTFFIKRLAELVLRRKGIVNPNIKKYNPQEVDDLTKAQFIWGAIRNRNKVSYSVDERSNETVTFLERVCEKFSEVEIQNTTTFGIPSKNSFTTTTCTSHIKKPIQVGHLDLVSIHFYENPSFIDLGVDQPYKEQHFFTFAGFIDYLIEKEDTKIVEDIIIAGLTAISMTVGFGEVVAAFRSVQVARALVGISTVVGDTSIYLTQNTAFKNHIIEKYPQDHERIMDVLMLGGSVFSLGGGIVSGSGILKTYSAEDAAQLVGFSRQVLTDADAVVKLTPNDLTIFRKGLDVFENGLFRVKYDIEFVKEVSRGRAVLKFYDNAALRAEIFSLDELSKLKFLDDYAELQSALVLLLKENSLSIAVWSGLDSAGKNIIKLDFESWIKGFQARKMLKTQDYQGVANLFGKDLLPGTEYASIPGVRWVIDGTPDIQALKEANDIANNLLDISLIATNYNVPIDVMTTFKNHFWVNEHFILENGYFQVGRFERLRTDILEWNAATANTLAGDDLTTFKQLICHEYVEAKLMEKGLSYRSLNKYINDGPSDFGAHELAPFDKLVEPGHPWYNQMHRRTDLPQPPIPNLNDFSNLDEIVDYFSNFYKL